MPQVWDELAAQDRDVQSQLPPSVRGQSMVIDDFGDVYGIFLAMTGDGFSFPELRRTSSSCAASCSWCRASKASSSLANSRRSSFLEISRQRLAQLGINEEQIYAKLQDRNIAADGGRIRVGDQHIPLDPTGAFARPRKCSSW
jgi:multidrug efflux pump subunit AcrB